ncbi:hypothetical protein GG344DRAFT_66833 [Lentinula edodes]|nr:hypothetical protein GG344DRAFT_66833 [Lentinula edodes]
MRLFVAVVIYDSIQTRYAYPIRGIGIGIIASSEARSVEPKERKKDSEDEQLHRTALTPLKRHTAPKQTRRDECNVPLSTSYEEGSAKAGGWSGNDAGENKGSARITRISGICGSRPKPGGGGTKEGYRGIKRRRLLEGTYREGTGGEKKKGDHGGGIYCIKVKHHHQASSSPHRSFTASRKRLREDYRAAKQRV